MRDKSGREYLKVKDAKPGLVELDSSFTCHCGGLAVLHTIKHDDGHSELYFYCDSGKHGLDGQINGDYYLGVYPHVPR